MGYARSASIKHDADRLSITYQLESVEQFFTHLKLITGSALGASDLARHLSIKALEKFDVFLPESVLDIANSHDRMDLKEAKFVAQNALNIAFNGVAGVKGTVLKN